MGYITLTKRQVEYRMVVLISRKRSDVLYYNFLNNRHRYHRNLNPLEV